MNKAEYKKQWYQKNKERMQAYNKEYRQKHRQELVQKDKKYYIKNRDKISNQKKEKYIANNRRAKIAKVALHYGCQNPACEWEGKSIPTQLHFHHKNRASKTYNVSSMVGMNLKKIADEINKCCVLCACCHAAVTVGMVTIAESICCKVDEKLKCNLVSH